MADGEQASDYQAMVGAALALSEQHKLPLTARSLTPDEQAARRLRHFAWYGCSGAVLALALPFAVAFAGSDSRQAQDWVRAALPFTLGLLALMLAAAWWRRRAVKRALREGAYVDPGITLEVKAHELVIERAGAREAIACGEVGERILELIGGGGFKGLVLDTAGSPIQIDDATFDKGRAAAACLIGRCAQSRPEEYGGSA